MKIPKISITGFSIPFFGLNWEYSDAMNQKSNENFNFDLNRKISVFISSFCDKDHENYLNVRKKLKNRLKSTGLFEVFLFEDSGASTLSANDYYVLAEHEDSDVVVFLIDNADGVPAGVQKEIEIAKKYNMKALFYFCTENSEEKTQVQKLHTGPDASKYMEIKKFGDLVEQGFHDLISDILNVYHYYCKNQLVILDAIGNEEVSGNRVVIEEFDSNISKTVLERLPQTRDKILRESLGEIFHSNKKTNAETSTLDVIAVQLLEVLFNGADIDRFDCESLLRELKKLGYSENMLRNIEIRLSAVKAYFKGNLDQCIHELEKGVEQSRSSNLPNWVQKDLLIDLRNVKLHRGTIKGTTEGYDVQDELNAEEGEVFYPLLDRICTDFHEKCIEELFNSKITSPYTVTFGSNLNGFGELLADMIVISMSYGSLTHILRMYREMQLFTFYLCCKYSDWPIQRNLFKFTIFNGREKEVDGLIRRYPNLQIQMDARDASIIMNFTNYHPLQYQKYKSHLLGIGAVGYFLSDVDFEKWSGIVFGEIYNWLDKMDAWMSVGSIVLKSIGKIQYRISQDHLISLIMSCLTKKQRFLYRDIFCFINEAVDINQLEESIADNFINEICRVVEEEFSDKNSAIVNPMFLATLRNQNRKRTDKLDEVIKEKLPQYYQNDYLLETSLDEQKDMPYFIDKYVDSILYDNRMQGRDGIYVGNSENKHRIIRNILESPNYNASTEVLDKVISAAGDTFLLSNVSVGTKIDALELILYIVLHDKNVVDRNIVVINKLKEVDYSTITYWDNDFYTGNVEADALELAYQLLMCSLGVEEYITCLTILTKTTVNQATTVRCLELVANFLLWVGDDLKNQRMIALFAMYAISHIHEDLLDIRWYAVNIILTLSDIKEYAEMANGIIIELVDNDNSYVKNLIQRNVCKHSGIEISTKHYVIEKCHNDNNFIVRYVLDKYGTDSIL